MKIKLREMGKNQKGKVTQIHADGELGRRIRSFGIIAGVDIKVVGEAPLYDPVAIKVRDTVLTLRNSEADYIYVEVAGENNEN